MNKRIFVIVMILFTLILIAGCGKDNSTDTQSGQSGELTDSSVANQTEAKLTSEVVELADGLSAVK